MNNVKINFEKLIQSIGQEIDIFLEEIKSGASSGDLYYKEILEHLGNSKILIYDEQMFVKVKEINANDIYVVVKFGSAPTNFGSSICPVTLSVLGTQNKIKPAQDFFSAFSTRWSLQTIYDDDLSTQIWVTPDNIMNFNETNNGFRALFNVSGTLIIGQSTVRLGTMTYVYNHDLYVSSNHEQGYEDIDFISFQDSFTNSLAPQPFGNTCGFAKSESNFSTFTFSIGTYLLNNQLVADCMAVKGFRQRSTQDGVYTSTKGPNDEFEIYLTFTNGFSNVPSENEEAQANDPVMANQFMNKFKCASIGDGQKIGEIPTINIAFSR